MSTKRSSVGVATLNDFLYAVRYSFRVEFLLVWTKTYFLEQIGGYDGQSRQCLSSVEYYNPTADSWHLIPDMSQRRSGAGVGVLDNRLYVVSFAVFHNLNLL